MAALRKEYTTLWYLVAASIGVVPDDPFGVIVFMAFMIAAAIIAIFAIRSKWKNLDSLKEDFKKREEEKSLSRKE